MGSNDSSHLKLHKPTPSFPFGMFFLPIFAIISEEKVEYIDVLDSGRVYFVRLLGHCSFRAIRVGGLDLRKSQQIIEVDDPFDNRGHSLGSDLRVSEP